MSLVESGPAGLLVSAQLAGFNALCPKDGDARRLAQGVRFSRAADLRLDIYAPRAGAVRAPVAVFFYGGSWNSGRRDFYTFAGKALAALGYVVVIPDYRLVPQIRFPGFLDDCAEAIAWTEANIDSYGGDPASLFLIGHSAGAYNALMSALDTRRLERSGAQPHSIRGAVGLAGPYDFFPFDVPASKAAFSHHPDPAETQPVTFAHAGAPDILLLHGEKDTLVRPRNSTTLAARLTQAGAQAEALIYPAVDHSDILLSLSVPFRRRSPALADISRFIEGCLKRTQRG
jgi:acetyl esterase/lipase